ncbi:hypothetical protein POX_d05777 [Penicillium oxalicum]|uniref:hypothetical protein n=1 Tax=Penicillium oxalicum TaxID=69781 RepID=UPI0020B6681B|nr:hypothetical protein POX_d05777 [Penicillium oxalicum]KAI2790268.1 hypothetical protein POX_d05777 [Penicillium oxalicum]
MRLPYSHVQNDSDMRHDALEEMDELEPFILSEDGPTERRLPRRLLDWISQTWRQAKPVLASGQVVGIFKCSLAYLLASMAVFIPVVGALLGNHYGKHLVATITVYFHPARSQGAMYKALICASVAFLFATFLSLGSMWVTIFFQRRHGLIELGHAFVLVVFVTGGFGLIGWIKQRQQDPLVNIACSLASLASILVLTKEGAVQSGDLSFTKISQILRMLLLGIGISTAVSFVVFPVSARSKFHQELSVLTSTTIMMLTGITKSFTHGRNQDIQTREFVTSAPLHDETFGRLTILLAETKLEHYVIGTRREHLMEKKLMRLIQDITHSLGGLRTAAALQSRLLAETKHRHTPRNSISTRYPLDAINSNNAAQRGGIEARRSDNSPDRKSEPSSFVPEGEDVPLSSHSPAEIFEQLTAGLTASILSLSRTLREIFINVNLGPPTEHRRMMNDELMTRITEAVDQYRDARRSAFLSLRRDWGRISPAQVDKARLEEIFANCEYFSVSLLELSEQLRELVLCMSELQAELDLRSTKNAWSWLQRACQPLCRRNLTQVAQTDSATGDTHSREDLRHLSHSLPLTSYSQRVTRILTQRLEPRGDVVRPFEFLRKDEMKFALKVGIGAALFALPSFVSVTRPIYLAWRGEWGLISYMLVCSMTIGASNTTGFSRFLGTCIGGLCSIGAWYFSGADAVKLALTGFAMAVGPFYLILVKGQGPMGRFILLTYNLSVLYAFSHIQTDATDPEDGVEHLDITSIVLRRVVSVMLGNAWGIIVTRGIWPIRARTKLDETLHSLWLHLAAAWKSNPLDALSEEHAQCPVLFIKAQDRAEIQRLLSQLDPLRKSALSEFELRDHFPEATYSKVIQRTRDIVDDFHSLDLVLSHLATPTEGQVSLLHHTVTTRRRLSDCIGHLFTTIASTVDLGHSLSDVPANVDRARDELLAQISRFRHDKQASHLTHDEDYALLYAYIIVSGQLSDELLQITAELGHIFPASDDALVGAVRV